MLMLASTAAKHKDRLLSFQGDPLFIGLGNMPVCSDRSEAQCNFTLLTPAVKKPQKNPLMMNYLRYEENKVLYSYEYISTAQGDSLLVYPHWLCTKS